METRDWQSQKRYARHAHDRASLAVAIQNA